MQVTITLKEPALSQAKQALIDRGIPVPQPFFGPVFENVKMASLAIPGFYGVVINDEDETEYFYPLSDISRIKLV